MQSSLTRAASVVQRGTMSNFLIASVANFRKAFLSLAVALLAIVQGAFNARAIIYTTPIIAQPESTTPFTWGDGIHELTETWSVQNPSSSGFVYGSSYQFDAPDVYDAGHINLASVADASVFSYSTDYVSFTEGDTIFFRGVDGFYGAWYVADVYPANNAPGGAEAYLNGTAYFQSDGSGNFTSVPEPSNLLLLLAGLGLLSYTSRFTRALPAQCE